MSSNAAVLHLNFSPYQQASHSFRLVQSAIARHVKQANSSARASQPRPQISQHCLAQIRLPDETFCNASLCPPQQRTSEQFKQLAFSEALLQQLESSSALILSMPLHNYTLPASCKAWLDWIVRPWRSFDFSAQGKSGLLPDKACAILISSGGPLLDGQQTDFASPYLRYVLNSIGISDLRFIYLQNTRRIALREAAQELAETALVQWLDQLI